MKSIKSPVDAFHEVSRSRFIGYLIHIDSEDEAKTRLEEIRNRYPDATHHVYAYVLGESGEIQKASDDGEPVRTAGFPVLDVLKKNGITDALAVVVRYFGGIKLGAGGLIRAYSNTVRKLLETADFSEKHTIDYYGLEVAYDQSKAIERFLAENALSVTPQYGETVTYLFSVDACKDIDVFRTIDNLTGGRNHLEKTGSRKEYR